MTSRLPWTPGTGDLISVRTAGSDASADRSASQRPAAVLSPAAFSARTGLAIVCPVVDEVRGYPFEVLVPSELHTSGAILVDRVTSVDLRRSPVRLLARLPDEVMTAVRLRLLALIAPAAGS